LPQPRREALLDRTELKPHTGKTLVDRASLARALDEARERGYALDDEEYDDGVRCVAVAVGPIGAPVAAISISGPASRLTKQRCVEFVPQMRRAATELSEALRSREGTAT
jgi:IclR family acetate operon transcriptional repressor